MLIYRVNSIVGINDFWFSLGDNVIGALVSGIQYLPVIIMMLAMCPKDSEGASFAMFTTLSNVGMAVGMVAGNGLVGIWDCSNATIKAGDYSGIGKLTMLTTAIQCIPILFISVVPDSPAEQEKMIEEGYTSKRWGGLLVFLLVASIIASVLNVGMSL